MENLLSLLAHPHSLLLSGLLFLIFVGLFHYFQGKINPGKRLKSLDARPGYTKAEVAEYFETIGPRGREIYRFVAGRLDMVFPFVYGLLMFTALVGLHREYGHRFPFMAVLFGLPVLTMAFDYWENNNTLRLLNDYPVLDEAQVNSAARITRIKRYLFILAMLPVLLAVVIGCLRWGKLV